jgi:hypothetical protein
MDLYIDNIVSIEELFGFTDCMPLRTSKNRIVLLCMHIRVCMCIHMMHRRMYTVDVRVYYRWRFVLSMEVCTRDRLYADWLYTDWHVTLLCHNYLFLLYYVREKNFSSRAILQT